MRDCSHCVPRVNRPLSLAPGVVRFSTAKAPIIRVALGRDPRPGALGATIPIGVIIGLLVFNETIDLNFLIGTLFIVGSTLFILYRERKKSTG